MDNVDFHGDYSKFECGLSFTVEPRHRGVWICELEKYHVGFDKRCEIVEIELDRPCLWQIWGGEVWPDNPVSLVSQVTYCGIEKL